MSVHCAHSHSNTLVSIHGRSSSSLVGGVVVVVVVVSADVSGVGAGGVNDEEVRPVCLLWWCLRRFPTVSVVRVGVAFFLGLRY